MASAFADAITFQQSENLVVHNNADRSFHLIIVAHEVSCAVSDFSINSVLDSSMIIDNATAVEVHGKSNLLVYGFPCDVLSVYDEDLFSLIMNSYYHPFNSQKVQPYCVRVVYGFKPSHLFHGFIYVDVGAN